MGLREDINNETVSQLPIHPAVTVPADTTVAQAVAAMKKAKLGCVFVVDDLGRPTGKFTERQVLRLVCDCVPFDEPVARHAVPIPEEGCVRLTDPVVKVLESMRTTRLRFLCVVDDEGKVAGLTGQKGLMAYITDHFPRRIKVQMMTGNLHMNSREGA
jgi:CBS domain-containing protein